MPDNIVRFITVLNLKDFAIRNTIIILIYLMQRVSSMGHGFRTVTLMAALAVATAWGGIAETVVPETADVAAEDRLLEQTQSPEAADDGATVNEEAA